MATQRSGKYGGGTKRERRPGVWQLRAYSGRDPVTDRPLQVTRTFRGSETAANKALAKLVSDVAEGKIESTTATVGQLLDAWLDLIEPTRALSTMREYRRKVKCSLRPAFGSIVLSKLHPQQIDVQYGKWLDEGLSPTTVRHYHAILSAACNQAVKWGWIERSPVLRASPPSVTQPTMKVPTPAQLVRLVAEAEEVDPVLAAAIALAALTGARRGELCALRWSDVDLVAGTVRIERAITVVDGMAYEGPTKTHQGRRIALDEVGVATLRRHRIFVEQRVEDVESELVADSFILSYQAHCGVPAGPDTITHRFSALCKRLPDMPPFHLHELRHFSVTTLIAAGVDARTVADRVGHADATMTLNRYAHALPERDREAAAILGGAFKSWSPAPMTGLSGTSKLDPGNGQQLPSGDYRVSGEV
jgi:integrase